MIYDLCQSHDFFRKEIVAEEFKTQAHHGSIRDHFIWTKVPKHIVSVYWFIYLFMFYFFYNVVNKEIYLNLDQRASTFYSTIKRVLNNSNPFIILIQLEHYHKLTIMDRQGSSGHDVLLPFIINQCYQ